VFVGARYKHVRIHVEYGPLIYPPGPLGHSPRLEQAPSARDPFQIPTPFMKRNEYRPLPFVVLRCLPFILYLLVEQHLHVNYLLPFGLAIMVIPEAVIALVARTPKLAVQFECGVGGVVDFTIRIAIKQSAHQIARG